MAALRIRLLGSFQVDLEETTVRGFESNKVRALLAYLAVESGQPHNRAKLAAMFWPEQPAGKAAPNLSRALYNLRLVIQDHRADPPYLLRSRDAVQFNPDSECWLDVRDFLEAQDQTRAMDPSIPNDATGDLANLEAAVQLYRGDFLEGLAFDNSSSFDEWVLVLRQRFQPVSYTHLTLPTTPYV